MATSGSFVGNPIGGPPYGPLLLVVSNDRNVHFNKNMTMIPHRATQIVSAGSFKEVSVSSLVLSLPTSTQQKKKKKIVGSFIDKKINHDDRLVEDLVFYTNKTVSSHHDPVVTLDKVAFVRPLLPIYKNISDAGGAWIFGDKKEEEEDRGGGRVLLNKLDFAICCCNFG